MDYNEFKTQLKEVLQAYLGESVKIDARQITKNNDTQKDAFLVSEKEGRISTVLYIEDFYKLLKEGVTLAEIAAGMGKIYRQSCGQETPDILLAHQHGSFQ